MKKSIQKPVDSYDRGIRGFGGLLATILLACLSFSCRSAAPGSATTVPAGTYYTKFSIRMDGNKSWSTNYRSEKFFPIPINTEVELLGASRHRFNMKLAGGRNFTFEHVPKHTLDTAQEAFDSFFSSTPVNLSHFSTGEQANIKAGKVELGMSRDAVLAAIGPPPASGTFSLTADTWKYSKTRWMNDLFVCFDGNGGVTSVGK